jgi:hypothetical protein
VADRIEDDDSLKQRFHVIGNNSGRVIVVNGKIRRKITGVASNERNFCESSSSTVRSNLKSSLLVTSNTILPVESIIYWPYKLSPALDKSKIVRKLPRVSGYENCSAMVASAPSMLVISSTHLKLYGGVPRDSIIKLGIFNH